MGDLLNILRTVNIYIGLGLMGAATLSVVYYVFSYSRTTIKDHGLANGVYLAVVLGIEALIVVGVLLIIPEFISRKFENIYFAAIPRWLVLLVGGTWYFTKRGIPRGLHIFLLIYSLLLFGWSTLGWIGILCIPMPLLVVLYFVSTQIANVLMPAYDLDNKEEKNARLDSFLSFLFGLNQPFWKSPSPSAREVEKRINGENSPFSKLKSLVWTYPHQVAGIIKGKEFKVRGPGLVFLEKGEQPFELVDLRNQSRKATIKAVSREGIQLTAEVSVAFCIDTTPYSREEYLKLKSTNVLLGKEPDSNLNGIFPYSAGRVKSALSLRSTRMSDTGIEITEYWDDHVLAMAEQAAREVLSRRSIEELWKARVLVDQSANEEIASEMREILAGQLRRLGVQLLSAKASNFTFVDEKEKNKEDEIINLQLSAWSVEWERRQSLLRADVEAEAERIQREARIYAHSALLTAIAEGLQQARELHRNLPRYVIALRFLGVLETMLDDQAGEEGQRARNQLKLAQQTILSKQDKE